MKKIKNLLRINFIFALLLLSSLSFSQDVLSLFPLDNYNQNISTWVNPDDKDYDTPLINEEIQQKHFDLFYQHYFGAQSPWAKEYVNSFLLPPPPDDLKSIEKELLQTYSNENKSDNEIGYGVNFRPYDKKWIQEIANNMMLSQLDGLIYQPEHRAIAIQNLNARTFPTLEPHFYSHQIAGQGYPFDNLQMSMLWAGTPLYVIAVTQDKAWSLVLTPEYIAWVKSEGVVEVSDDFINKWQRLAKTQLAAITQTKTSLTDKEGRFLHLAYVGEVYPSVDEGSHLTLFIPIRDESGRVMITKARVSKKNAMPMPVSLTPHHIATILTTLANRPYGWGGLYFFNDCSQELKALFAPFGIWLPRHSKDQVHVTKMDDLSSATPKERIDFLMKHGRPFLTLVYIGGHVMLYLDNVQDPNSTDHTLVPMTYQNIWGLKPDSSTRRAVIGKAVFFPLLLRYPEDPSLSSLASRSYFQIAYLDQLLPSSTFKQQNKGLRAGMLSESD